MYKSDIELNQMQVKAKDSPPCWQTLHQQLVLHIQDHRKSKCCQILNHL